MTNQQRSTFKLLILNLIFILGMIVLVIVQMRSQEKSKFVNQIVNNLQTIESVQNHIDNMDRSQWMAFVKTLPLVDSAEWNHPYYLNSRLIADYLDLSKVSDLLKNQKDSLSYKIDIVLMASTIEKNALSVNFVASKKYEFKNILTEVSLLAFLFASLIVNIFIFIRSNNSISYSRNKLLPSLNVAEVPELKVNEIFETIADGVVAFDDTGRVYKANSAAAIIFGYTPAEMESKLVTDFISHTDLEKFINFYQALIQGSDNGMKVEERKLLGKRENTEQFPLEVIVRPLITRNSVYYVMTCKDLTKHVQFKSEFVRNQKMQSAIIESSLDALITINKRDEIIEFSAAAERIFGWSRKEVIGETMNNILVPEALRAAHQIGMQHFLETGTGPLIGKRTEIEALHKTGHLIPIELGLIGFEHEGERLATAFVRDITETKKSEQELRDAKDAAESASKAKSRFLSYMSHEIRSPLNAVLGAMNLLSQKIKSREQLQYFNIAQSAGQNLLSVINEILDFSKIEAGHIQVSHSETNLRELVSRVMMVADSKNKNSQVVLTSIISPEVPDIILSDPTKLNQIITIMLDNALSFTKEGAVNVRLAMVEELVCGGDWCAIKDDTKNNACIQIEVSDSGFGISADMLNSIFAEFEQVDPARDTRFGGTGLGLAIAKRYTKALGGEISVESTIGQGSRFLIMLPCEKLTAIEEKTHKTPVSNQLLLLSSNQFVHSYFESLLTAYKLKDQVELFFFKDEMLLEQALNDLDEDNYPLVFIDSIIKISPFIEALLNSDLRTVTVLYHPLTDAEAWSERSCYYMQKPLDDMAIVNFICGVKQKKSAHLEVANNKKLSGEILLVEDVAVNRMVARDILRSRGLTVTEASDGFEAVEQAKLKQFNLILMDIRMPRLNGFEATQIIRSQSALNKNTPIIALTANAETSEIERCRLAGFNEFISKPFDVTHLINVIKKFVNQPISEIEMNTESTINFSSLDDNYYDVLDDSSVEQLIKDTSLATLPAMFLIFVEELDKRVIKLKDAEHSKDFEEIREQAHAIKSCSGTFGAKRLYECSRELELHAKQQQLNFVELMREVNLILTVIDTTRKVYIDYRDKVQKKINAANDLA